MEKNGRLCKCGQRGCAEMYISKNNIKERFLENLKVIDDKRILEETTDYLALSLANASAMFKPERIILAGELFEEESYIKEMIKTKLQQTLKVVNLPEIKFGINAEVAMEKGALRLLNFSKIDKNVYFN
ncbi:MAG: ROK family protein [Candidatus Dojkabacteria bacterium]|nr:ROK family protein [Candidatus Dojkabacteria bacterium]MDQ7020544.1 ROK family protein [Candidatus Dojkabacteria bacterium]